MCEHSTTLRFDSGDVYCLECDSYVTLRLEECEHEELIEQTVMGDEMRIFRCAKCDKNFRIPFNEAPKLAGEE